MKTRFFDQKRGVLTIPGPSKIDKNDQNRCFQGLKSGPRGRKRVWDFSKVPKGRKTENRDSKLANCQFRVSNFGFGMSQIQKFDQILSNPGSKNLDLKNLGKVQTFSGSQNLKKSEPDET